MRAKYFAILCLAAFLCACETEPFTFNLGEDLVVTSTKVTMVDTLTVQLSTYKKDSIVTSGMETLLAGLYHDDVFGDISARSYFQIGLPEVNDVDDAEICDSVSLILQYNQFYRGDTLQDQVYYVYELTEELEEDEDGGIYSSAGFSHSAEPIGTIRFSPGPCGGDELEIPLNIEVGEDILEYVQDNTSSLSEDDFLEIINGFVIAPAESESQSVLGFEASDSSLYLKLYTHEPGPTNSQLEHKFPMTNSYLQYNQISFDLSCAPAFDSITEDEGLLASYSESIAYIYGGLGLYTKVNFPYLSYLTGAAELKNSILVSANLYLEPFELDKDKSELLEEVRIYETEHNGDVGDVLLDESSLELEAKGNLDYIYDENTFFVFDLTDYVNIEVADYYLDPEFGFYLDFTDSVAVSTLDELMLDGSQTAGNNMRIELTFFYYDL